MARHVLHIGVLAVFSEPLKCEESPWKERPENASGNGMQQPLG